MPKKKNYVDDLNCSIQRYESEIKYGLQHIKRLRECLKYAKQELRRAVRENIK